MVPCNSVTVFDLISDLVEFAQRGLVYVEFEILESFAESIEVDGLAAVRYMRDAAGSVTRRRRQARAGGRSPATRVPSAPCRTFALRRA
jgi:hypothetical protein